MEDWKLRIASHDALQSFFEHTLFFGCRSFVVVVAVVEECPCGTLPSLWESACLRLSGNMKGPRAPKVASAPELVNREGVEDIKAFPPPPLAHFGSFGAGVQHSACVRAINNGSGERPSS